MIAMIPIVTLTLIRFIQFISSHILCFFGFPVISNNQSEIYVSFHGSRGVKDAMGGVSISQ